MHGESDYGLWGLVFINSAIFIFFCIQLCKTAIKDRLEKLGGFFRFYICFVHRNVWVSTHHLFFVRLVNRALPKHRFFFAHENGHLLRTILGLEGDAHWSILHIISNVLIVAGFFILSSAWNVLHHAQKNHSLANTGWYARCRHPQYLAFIIIMFGFLLQWPTIPTLIMFPILTLVYIRLAKREEKAAIAEFGERYLAYKDNTPAWLPKLSSSNLQYGN